MNEKGEFIGIDDDFNSEKGIIAMKGMQQLAQSSCYDSNADIFTDAGVIITGIWNAEKAEEHFGENFAATDLPSFTVDGQSYHLSSFTGNKLMGVKPQQDAAKGAVLALLAEYLTSEECQMQRYTSFQWGPSNKKAQASEAVQANPSLAALAKQGEYGIPQGQIEGMWWDTAKVLGAAAKAATSETDMQTALTNYDKAIEEFLKLPPEVRRAWTVIGNVGGANWDTDFTMTEGPENTWTSVAIEMKAGQMFKVRQGLSWTNNYGAEGKFNSSDNILVEADGTYQVVFVWDGDTSHDATITLVPVTE
jgi:arabinogalactan oligomer/maltooligosaccharide transport system substrate-binding protein